MRQILPLMALLLTAGQSLAADATATGRQLLDGNCSRCHAIGAGDQSPHAQAPPFREVVKRYDPDSLQEALVEGPVTGHADMPEFTFTPEETDAIITYLKALEAR